ncbi:MULTISPECIES: oxygenase MpaB family protein [Gordonia]|uniref:oxygenase MpaB family protein n=1 Tax=Gordonia TaxID=2053 RepID=UPI001FF9C777|nr:MULTISPECIES: oxygenase MpaB family protein [Gordonia]MCT1354885.1 oxygenase MpaB family protein [Gordonia sp. p3-SID1431]UPG67716.1 oxygenase MpaB family protein [Gordonia hongkongensis]
MSEPDRSELLERSADGDVGYFGPDSWSWKVFLHPATQVMIAQITNALESPHIVFQHVLAEHDPVFGAPSRTARVPDGPQVTFFERVQRTVSVPAPILFGSKSQADLAARKLFNYHRPMRGTIAGTSEKYAATDESSMLFAAVTIVHAAMLAYENFAYQDGRRVRRLTKEEVCEYLSEGAQIAVLMGVPRDAFPTSPDQLDDYYDSVADQFRTKQGWSADRLRAIRLLTTLGNGRRPRHVAVDLVLGLSELMCLAVLPEVFRRGNGVPTIADPLLRLMYVAVQPLFRRLGSSASLTTKVHDLYRRDDPLTSQLLDNALRLTASHTEPQSFPFASTQLTRHADGRTFGEYSAVQQVFDELPAVEAGELRGRWRGTEILTKHRLDGSLERIGWYGKHFDGEGNALPILIQTQSGRIHPLNPALIPTPLFLRPPKLPQRVDRLLRRVLNATVPITPADRPAASVRMMDYRGEQTAAMIYDKQPVIDLFKSAGPNVVLGAMQSRAEDRPHFFLLEKDDDARSPISVH